MPSSVIFARYVLFALLSTAINLATQEVVFRSAAVMPLETSILAGTAAGFFSRYLLEKKWVFLDPYSSVHADELRKFALYGATAVATTLLFWTIEIACWLVWRTAAAKYTGAVIGLSIGYVAKYFLDRKFVFKVRSP